MVAREPDLPPVIGDEDPDGDPETWFEWAGTWARAVALGVRDTAKDMLEAGRQGARAAQLEYWAHFDELTKNRRTRP
jgi:hypothetical protein